MALIEERQAVVDEIAEMILSANTAANGGNRTEAAAIREGLPVLEDMLQTLLTQRKALFDEYITAMNSPK
jgi:hypothetical protein